jgi:uncharacterized protein with NRDE domain
MCLLLVAHSCHDDYRLIVGANRDEFYTRAAANAAFWDNQTGILGGRDLQGRGTWLAVNRAGRFAAITNVRIPHPTAAPRSRGLIISDYLTNKLGASRFVDDLSKSATAYEGFNILVADPQSLAWFSNRAPEPRTLDSGVYGLSNHLLDTPWPKVTRIKADFIAAQGFPEDALIEAIFKSLSNQETAPDRDLPETGIGLEHERVLAPIFIAGDTYGTRCSTVVLIDRRGVLTFIERRFGPHKSLLGESAFKFEIDAPSN